MGRIGFFIWRLTGEVGMGRKTEIMRGTVIGEDKLTLNYTNASTASWLWLLCISQLMLKGSLNLFILSFKEYSAWIGHHLYTFP